MGVPPSLARFRDEPAFSPEDTTFCLWWDAARPGWQTGVSDWPPGDDPDGSATLLFALDGRAETYQTHAREYFEIEVSTDIINLIFAHRPLSKEVISSINPDADADDVMRSARAARYGA